MKLLLHICCAPCAVYPLSVLGEHADTVIGFFYRHNIHPFTECQRRQETLAGYAESIGLKVIYQKGYEPETFLRNVVFREADRCRYCYSARLEATARLARASRFDAFSTTLLYSRFQQHELIRSLGEAIGRQRGIPFYYQDFRVGWKSGIETSKALGLYRQPYCGCIYSEKERYVKPAR